MAKRKPQGRKKERRYSPLEDAYYRQKVYRPITKITPTLVKKVAIKRRDIGYKISVNARIKKIVRNLSHRLEDRLFRKATKVNQSTKRAHHVDSFSSKKSPCKKIRERQRRAYFGYVLATPRGKQAGVKNQEKHEQRFTTPTKCRR